MLFLKTKLFANAFMPLHIVSTVEIRKTGTFYSVPDLIYGCEFTVVR